MDAGLADTRLAQLAAAIAEPARARMLCCLMDGHARTSTELAVAAQVSASTASAHLARLREQSLVELIPQGKYRYYRLASGEVGAALESLLVVAGVAPPRFAPSTPHRLRLARTCYDHMAGTLAVALHDRFAAQKWIIGGQGGGDYSLSADGAMVMEGLGINVAGLQKLRRRFACSCLDWSERRPHLGGALGAALLKVSLSNGWVEQDLDSRALSVTREGRRQFERRFGHRVA